MEIKNRQLDMFINYSKANADNDLTLASAIKASKAKVVLGHFFHISQAGLDYEIAQEEIDNQLDLISNSRYPLIRYEDQNVDLDPFIKAYAPESNIDVISRSSESSGYFNMFPDQDGVVRWIPLILKCGEEIYSPLAVQTAWNYLDNPQMIVKVTSYGIEGVQMGDRFIPTDENGQVLINYLGPGKTFPHYSISDILHGNLPKGTFEDTIVMLGATAIGVYDMRNTPFSPVFPGLEIHATVIDNILSDDFLYKPKWAKIYDILAILALGLLTGLILPRLSAVKAILFTLFLFILHIFISRWFFSQFGLWINLLYPLLTIGLIYTSLTLYHYITEERERKKIRGAFSYYVSSSVVNEMLKDPEKLKLGGAKKDISVLFSDIRSFTTISEGLTPEELVHLLNEYLTVMTDIVFKHGGTLDKYMGDAIMALYGAPLEIPDHPARACRSALEMMEGLKMLNEDWISQGKTPLDIGIGINTGMMMAGNMGSDQRFDYTVMGDHVNLGSRLEGANKSYKTNILISEFTYERVKDEFVCMELDCVRVKGKTLPVNIYQLIGERDYVSQEQIEAISHFHKGLQLYKKQSWDNAISTFEMVSAMNKDIYAAELYIERANDLRSNPPPTDWDGVCTMKTK
ncbi:MAG: adenylate/guanylate cyclase domain-containing protein [Deltaproteobacteria bacterium]|nr:adenylate/guanylate cyclase domain-containing protein [Deltaproteobacteria bacterium]